jgi:cobyrinic acid a,c-diamide synthase
VATLGPRLVVSGIGSGVGKTTVATGLMAALRRRGLRVGSAKVGPDFIDPGYHAVATGRPGRSLDAWLSGEELLAPLAASAGGDVDVLVVEGVMGLFDGSGEPGVDGSTADVARRLAAPVVLVLDVWTMSGSVAAIVHGFRDFDPGVRIAGVVLNRVAGVGHATLCREALEPLGVPVLGAIAHDDRLTWRDRHLGLVPVAEHQGAVRSAVDRIAAVIDSQCDLEALVRLANSAPGRVVAALPHVPRVGDVRVAVAGGPSFNFVYPENLALLVEAGAELAYFDPLSDTALPEGSAALYAAGGFPEVFARALSENHSLNQAVRQALADGLVTWAECGGLLWLCESLDGHPMIGAIPARARMTDRLTIGYRSATTRVESPIGSAGTELRGHEFHQSALEPAGDALDLWSRFGGGRAGHATTTLFASYLHQHLAASPEIVERFIATAVRSRRTG